LSKTITAGSTIMISFATEYRIPSGMLANCQGSRISTVAPTSSTCSSVYSAGLDVFSIIFSDLYTFGGAQTFLRLKVLIL